MKITLRVPKILIFISLLFLFIGLSRPVIAQPDSVQAMDGSELFMQYRCAACHTIGRGVFVGPDLKGVGERYDREDLIRWIENPQLIYNETGKMPVNEGFPPMPPMQVPPEAAKVIADYVLSVEPDSGETAGGTITGKVLLGKDRVPEHGVGISLTPYMGDIPSGDPKVLLSAEDGSYSFTELPWDRSYQISINYKGAEYSTDKMVFAPGEEEKTLDLPVFEPTLTDENIRVNEAQIIVQVLEGVVTVADISVFENTGDTIYVGGKDLGEGRKESVRYSLPEDAGNIALIHGLDQESIVQTDIGFSDTTSILPGPRRAVFTYSVPLESGETIVDKEILYPTGRMLLLVLDTGEEFSVKGLTKEESVTINEETFLKWSGEALGAGSEIVIEIGTGGLIGGSYTTWAALGILLLVVLAGAIYSLTRQKETSDDEQPKEQPKTPEVPDTASLEEKRNILIKEIAALDDKKEAGEIEEAEYIKLRESKKKEVLDITSKLRST